MAFSKDKLQDKVFEAIDAVFDDCIDIAPVGAFEKNRPSDAWIVEILSFASYIAKVDGKISKDEVKALKEMYSKAGTKVSKSIMNIMALALVQEDLDMMPYELDEVIAKDNARLAAGNDRIPASIWLACLYYWTAQYIISADGKNLAIENSVSKPVLERILSKLYTQLNLPNETIKKLFNITLNSIL